MRKALLAALLALAPLVAASAQAAQSLSMFSDQQIWVPIQCANSAGTAVACPSGVAAVSSTPSLSLNVGTHAFNTGGVLPSLFISPTVQATSGTITLSGPGLTPATLNVSVTIDPNTPVGISVNTGNVATQAQTEPSAPGP